MKFTKEQLQEQIRCHVEDGPKSGVPVGGVVTMLTHWVEGIIKIEVEHALKTQRNTLLEVANDFETAGCDGCGTMSVKTMNKLRKLLDWDPLIED